jgi:hypothetical protein
MGLKLGDLSPVYGAIKGEGMFGDLLGKKSAREDAAKIAADKAKADEAEAKKAEQAAKNTAVLRSQGMGGGMKKGGAVRSASSRADGIATKGKTRGRMV